MTNKELLEKIEALNEWEAILEEAKKEADKIREEIKADMASKELEEQNIGQYIIR